MVDVVAVGGGGVATGVVLGYIVWAPSICWR